MIEIAFDAKEIAEICRQYKIRKSMSEKQLRKSLIHMFIDYKKGKLTIKQISGVSDSILFDLYEPYSFKDEELTDVLDSARELYYYTEHAPRNKWLEETESVIDEFLSS